MDFSAIKTRDDVRRDGDSKNIYRRYVKRAFDLVGAIVLLPILLPVIFGLWALVRLDGGPGFFTQTRIGENGRRFNFIKLRSMVVDSDRCLAEAVAGDSALALEWQEMQKLREDPRITPLGSFLRKSSLDELPQIFNVLWGDMSLVGPRPFTDDQEEMYRQGGGRSYFAMRPGITGLWQVSGRSQTTFRERVRFDDAYYQDCSLTTDLKILFKTVFVVAKGTGT